MQGNRSRGTVPLALNAGVEVPALCDIKEPNLNRAIDVVDQARGREPEGYSRGPQDRHAPFSLTTGYTEVTTNW